MENFLIKEIQSAKELRRFIAFPNAFYNGNPFRVTQLFGFENSTLLFSNNPAHIFCQSKYFLAYEGTQIVGVTDFVDDIIVSSALIRAVQDWGKSDNITVTHGLFGFNDMDMERMLVNGYYELRTQAVIYNYPYYWEHLELQRFKKDFDWMQIEINLPIQIPEKPKKYAAHVSERYGLNPLKFKKAKDLIFYNQKMFHTLNDAFVDVYGLVQLTDKQIDYYINHYFIENLKAISRSYNLCDSCPIFRAFGFEPEYDLTHVLQESTAWYKIKKMALTW
jgi:hypothetical protein